MTKLALDSRVLRNLHEKNQQTQNFQLNQTIKSTLKFAVYLECILWSFSIVLVVLYKTSEFAYSKAVYNEKWPFLIQIAYKTLFSAFVICGYCLGNAHQSDYLYAILHNYCQMNILITFLKDGLDDYKELPWQLKIRSMKYQKSVQEHLITTFQRFQNIKLCVFSSPFLSKRISVKCFYFRDGRETALIYGKINFLHFFIEILVVSLAVHCVCFVSVFI